MPRYIVKLTDDETNVNYYLEWSSVVDAPVTRGMSKDDFIDYYLGKYGTSSLGELNDRMMRVEGKGTSAILYTSALDLISVNRAGKDESNLTFNEILQQYCK